MKKKILLTLIALATLTTMQAQVEINETNFPDDYFRSYVKSEFDKDANGSLSDAERAAVTEISVSSKHIASLTGIEYFTGLTKLFCGNNQLTALNVSKNTELKMLICSMNQLTTLDVSKNTKLTLLEIVVNNIGEEAMNALAESLPTATDGLFYVIAQDLADGNVCSTVAVATAKGKGWKVLAYDSNGNKIDYAGTAPAGINTLLASPQKEAPRHNLSGQRVSDSHKGIIVVNGKKVVVK